MPPLQTSGAISLENIRAEFGGGYPIQLSQYYRGGGLVPNIGANSNVPTSGAISLSNFYGATAVDLVPDAVNWNNISPVAEFDNNVRNNNQTISGITSDINLIIEITNPDFYQSIGTASLGVDIFWEVNNTQISGTGILNPSNGVASTGNVANFNVSNGQQVRFRVYASYTITSTQEGFYDFGYTSTVNIRNSSNSNQLLDSFDIGAQYFGSI